MPNSIKALIIFSIIGICLLLSMPFMVESNTASEILVITRPDGTVSVYDKPGWHWQGFGTATHYARRGTIEFSGENFLKMRFNDSGTAKMWGIVNYELNGDENQIKTLHSQFSTPEAVENKLIRGFLETAMFNTGSLLSSTESYSSSRGSMFEMIQNQVQEGIYSTDGSIVKEKDLMGFERTLTKIRIRTNSDGQYVYSKVSPLKEFGINCSVNLNNIEYDDKVDQQIQAQLDATIKVQTAIAEAKKAEQDKITAEQTGFAKKAEAEAIANVEMARATIEAEKEKAVAITQAEKLKEVAQLALETAKLEAAAVIEKGKADSEARKLLMEADGALEKKLQAYTEVQASWAKAYAESKQPHTAAVIMGQKDGVKSNNSASDLLEIIASKAALDLGLDMRPNNK